MAKAPPEPVREGGQNGVCHSFSVSEDGVWHGRAAVRLRQGYGGRARHSFSEGGPVRRSFSEGGKKMYTFVSGKNVIDSVRYADFMSTFVYLLEKAGSAKSRT